MVNTTFSYTTENMDFLEKNGFYIGNRHFMIMLASDINTRDGLGWQLVEIVSNELVLILEIFRHDDLKEMEFVTYSPISIPFKALEFIVNDFSSKGG